ncbi:MAG: hypothetical protein ACKOZM_09690 [Flavobacteriales bacterium]
MDKIYTTKQIATVVSKLNSRFNCSIDVKELGEREYSASSLKDLLIQRISDELSGEWTTERAYHTLKNGLIKLRVPVADISMDSPLEKLVPPPNRRQRMNEWSRSAGIELDVLKPNSFLYGTLVFLFFVFIPLGFGMDWFLSGIGMCLCALGIFTLNKTASNFRMQTLGQMAEVVAWRLYLQQQKNGAAIDMHSITLEVQQALSNVED